MLDLKCFILFIIVEKMWNLYVLFSFTSCVCIVNVLPTILYYSAACTLVVMYIFFILTCSQPYLKILWKGPDINDLITYLYWINLLSALLTFKRKCSRAGWFPYTEINMGSFETLALVCYASEKRLSFYWWTCRI